MKLAVAVFVLLISVSPCWSEWGDPLPPGLIGIMDTPDDKAVCRCEYYKSPNYGQLVLTRSCDLNAPKRALMKIDGKPVDLGRLKSNVRPGCKRGSPLKEIWSAPGIRVTLDGAIAGPGEESCWFKGDLVVEKGNKKQTMQVEGACGI